LGHILLPYPCAHSAPGRNHTLARPGGEAPAAAPGLGFTVRAAVLTRRTGSEGAVPAPGCLAGGPGWERPGCRNGCFCRGGYRQGRGGAGRGCCRARGCPGRLVTSRCRACPRCVTRAARRGGARRNGRSGGHRGGAGAARPGYPGRAA